MDRGVHQAVGCGERPQRPTRDGEALTAGAPAAPRRYQPAQRTVGDALVDVQLGRLPLPKVTAWVNSWWCFGSRYACSHPAASSTAKALTRSRGSTSRSRSPNCRSPGSAWSRWAVAVPLSTAKATSAPASSDATDSRSCSSCTIADATSTAIVCASARCSGLTDRGAGRERADWARAPHSAAGQVDPAGPGLRRRLDGSGEPEARPQQRSSTARGASLNELLVLQQPQDLPERRQAVLGRYVRVHLRKALRRASRLWSSSRGRPQQRDCRRAEHEG